MILVTGGTGNVGASIVSQLLDAGEKVRVITRNPDRAFPEGAEVVPGDLNRPETLPEALSGVDRAFLFPVLNGAVDGFLHAALQAHLQHVVLMSTTAVTFQPIGGVGQAHLQLEQAVEASGLPWTFVRPDAFMTNDLHWAPQIATSGVVRGVYGNAALAPIDPRDIAAVAVRALLDQRTGEAFMITGSQSLTQIDRVRIIAETIGRPVRFEEQPREQYREQMISHGMPAPVIDELIAGLAARDGKTAHVHSTVQDVTGRPAFTYAQWAASHASTFAGSAPA